MSETFEVAGILGKRINKGSNHSTQESSSTELSGRDTRLKMPRGNQSTASAPSRASSKPMRPKAVKTARDCSSQIQREAS